MPAVAEHFNDYGFPHHPDLIQDVLNKSSPPPEVARELKDRPDAIPVQVRIVFEAEGEQWLDGMARRWHGRWV